MTEEKHEPERISRARQGYNIKHNNVIKISQIVTGSVNYKYTAELISYVGILGSEEELNNYKRWETHEDNHDITRVTRYADRITHKP